jgi:hypothetical protein
MWKSIDESAVRWMATYIRIDKLYFATWMIINPAVIN